MLILTLPFLGRVGRVMATILPRSPRSPKGCHLGRTIGFLHPIVVYELFCLFRWQRRMHEMRREVARMGERERRSDRLDQKVLLYLRVCERASWGL